MLSLWLTQVIESINYKKNAKYELLNYKHHKQYKILDNINIQSKPWLKKAVSLKLELFKTKPFQEKL